MKFHSSVDLITNSSTVIFSTLSEKAEESIKKAITALFSFDTVGIELKDFDECFEIRTTRGKDWEEDRGYEWEDMDEKEQAIYGTFEDFLVRYEEDDYDYRGDSKTIEVYSKKTGEKLNIVNLISGVYSWDATNDG